MSSFLDFRTKGRIVGELTQTEVASFTKRRIYISAKPLPAVISISYLMIFRLLQKDRLKDLNSLFFRSRTWSTREWDIHATSKCWMWIPRNAPLSISPFVRKATNWWRQNWNKKFRLTFVRTFWFGNNYYRNMANWVSEIIQWITRQSQSGLLKSQSVAAFLR